MSEQRFIIEENNLKKEELQKQLIELNIVNKLIEKSLNNLAGVESIPYKKDESINLSPTTTLSFIKNSSNLNGIDVKSIIEQYAARGTIIPHARVIFDHINKLLKDKIIYQTNPDQVRGRKYKLTDNH